MVDNPQLVFTLLSRDRDLDRGRIPANTGGGPGPLTRPPPDVTSGPDCSEVQLSAVKEGLLHVY
jgi:hypothetical protein